MKQFKNLTIVEDKEDFEENWDYDWEKLDSITLYVKGVGQITNKNKDELTFPLYLEYCEPWETHSCGEYYSMAKQRAILAVEAKIADIKQDLADCVELMKMLKNWEG